MAGGSHGRKPVAIHVVTYRARARGRLKPSIARMRGLWKTTRASHGLAPVAPGRGSPCFRGRSIAAAAPKGTIAYRFVGAGHSMQPLFRSSPA
jgi:hypothetical protein